MLLHTCDEDTLIKLLVIDDDSKVHEILDANNIIKKKVMNNNKNPWICPILRTPVLTIKFKDNYLTIMFKEDDFYEFGNKTDCSLTIDLEHSISKLDLIEAKPCGPIYSKRGNDE